MPSLLICQGKYPEKAVSPEMLKRSPPLDDFRFDHPKDSFPVCHYWVSCREISSAESTVLRGQNFSWSDAAGAGQCGYGDLD